MATIEIFVMSKCPDAYYTESFIHSLLPSLSPQSTPLSAHSELRGAQIGSQVVLDSTPKGINEGYKEGIDVKLEFITNEDGSCKHGLPECNGNRLLLSIQHFQVVNILDFVVSYNKDPGMSMDEVKVLLSEMGASKEKIDEVMDFYDSDKSQDLLDRSGEYSRSLGIQYSATVRVNSKIIAIRDGNKWRYLDGVNETKESWIKYLSGLPRDGL